ncbi:hypothetical protein AVEN_43931-1, partial [Araneus ventricosus]
MAKESIVHIPLPRSPSSKVSALGPEVSVSKRDPTEDPPYIGDLLLSAFLGPMNSQIALGCCVPGIKTLLGWKLK